MFIFKKLIALLLTSAVVASANACCSGFNSCSSGCCNTRCSRSCAQRVVRKARKTSIQQNGKKTTKKKVRRICRGGACSCCR